MTTPFERPVAPKRKMEEFPKSPLYPADEITTDEAIKNSHEGGNELDRKAREIAIALGHNDPDKVKQFLRDEDH